jgi:hypothetical protein
MITLGLAAALRTVTGEIDAAKTCGGELGGGAGTGSGGVAAVEDCVTAPAAR